MAKKAVRNRYVTVRFSDSEYVDLKQSASRAGCASVSEYVRTVADGTQKNVITIAVDTNDLHDSTQQLARIGNNLNQIAHKLNSGDELTKKEENELLNKVKDISKEMRDLRKEISEVSAAVADCNSKRAMR